MTSEEPGAIFLCPLGAGAQHFICTLEMIRTSRFLIFDYTRSELKFGIIWYGWVWGKTDLSESIRLSGQTMADAPRRPAPRSHHGHWGEVPPARAPSPGVGESEWPMSHLSALPWPPPAGRDHVLSP